MSASTTFDFPEPFGPTTQVIPGSRRRVVAEAKDLNPLRVRLFKYTAITYRGAGFTLKSDSAQLQLEGLIASLRAVRISNAARAADCSASRLLFPVPTATNSPPITATASKLLS